MMLGHARQAGAGKMLVLIGDQLPEDKSSEAEITQVSPGFPSRMLNWNRPSDRKCSESIVGATIVILGPVLVKVRPRLSVIAALKTYVPAARFAAEKLKGLLVTTPRRLAPAK